MARREKTAEETMTAGETAPTDDDLVELDGKYEFNGEKYGPGKVQIEGRQARRAILRAMDNAKEERETKAEKTSEVVP